MSDGLAHDLRQAIELNGKAIALGKQYLNRAQLRADNPNGLVSPDTGRPLTKIISDDEVYLHLIDQEIVILRLLRTLLLSEGERRGILQVKTTTPGHNGNSTP